MRFFGTTCLLGLGSALIAAQNNALPPALTNAAASASPLGSGSVLTLRGNDNYLDLPAERFSGLNEATLDGELNGTCLPATNMCSNSTARSASRLAIEWINRTWSSSLRPSCQSSPNTQPSRAVPAALGKSDCDHRERFDGGRPEAAQRRRRAHYSKGATSPVEVLDLVRSTMQSYAAEPK